VLLIEHRPRAVRRPPVCASRRPPSAVASTRRGRRRWSLHHERCVAPGGEGLQEEDLNAPRHHRRSIAQYCSDGSSAWSRFASCTQPLNATSSDIDTVRGAPVDRSRSREGPGLRVARGSAGPVLLQTVSGRRHGPGDAARRPLGGAAPPTDLAHPAVPGAGASHPVRHDTPPAPADPSILTFTPARTRTGDRRHRNSRTPKTRRRLTRTCPPRERRGPAPPPAQPQIDRVPWRFAPTATIGAPARPACETRRHSEGGRDHATSRAMGSNS
jgi:hypothetical protein